MLVRKKRSPKEPSLLRQIVAVHYEQARRRKALRLLERQSWSLDFLAMVVSRAAKMSGQPVSVELIDRNGTKMRIASTSGQVAEAAGRLDDSIFNHLDDEVAIQRFVAEHSLR